MNFLLRLSKKITGHKEERQAQVFLCLNIAVSMVIGILIWLAVMATIGGTVIGLICTTGYSMVFLGALGGMLYLMNHDLW